MTKKPIIIAEIGNNHEGSIHTAKKLIESAYKCGVDAVKFQTFKTEDFVNNKEKKRFSKLKKFELSQEQFKQLAKFAKKKNLKFISTPFDIKSAEYLSKIVDYFKISSGDNNFQQLIDKVISYKKPTIISCGFLDIIEIKKLVKNIRRKKFPLNKLYLLHCVSSYPVNDKEANMRSIQFLKKKLGLNIGYSDHTLGVEASIIATAYGADMIEKHFTLNKNYSKFRDPKISADKKEMVQIVKSVTRTALMKGNYEKKITKTEKKNLKSMRRSIYSKFNIKKGERVTIDKIKFVRPYKYLKTTEVKKIINKKIKINFKKNQPLLKEVF